MTYKIALQAIALLLCSCLTAFSQKVDYPHNRTILKYSITSLLPLPYSTQALSLEYVATPTMNIEHELGYAPPTDGLWFNSGEEFNKWGWQARTQLKFYRPEVYRAEKQRDVYFGIDLFYKKNFFEQNDWLWQEGEAFREFALAEREKTVYGFHFLYGILKAPLAFEGMYLDTSFGLGLRVVRNQYDPRPIIDPTGFRRNLAIPSAVFSFKFGWARPMKSS